MADLDPEVQITIIDLAAGWVEDTKYTETGQIGAETLIKRRAERFDQAYKAIVKAIAPE